MTTSRQRTGRLGEEIAAKRLAAEGYRILAKNHRTPYGEIDLVCERDGVVAFVEVRTRRPNDFGRPEQSITREKAAHIADSAQHYVQGAAEDLCEWRVDLVAIELGHNGRLLRYEVIQNAVEI